MEMKHTPGPWEAICYDCDPNELRKLGDDGIRYWTVLETGKYRGEIANVSDARHIGGITLQERDANTRLITAAPDLLDVVIEAVELYGMDGGPWNVPSDPGGWLSRARAAIAKATGGVA